MKYGSQIMGLIGMRRCDAGPVRRCASGGRASRKHLVCMRAHNGSKTLRNWLPIQFSGGRKRKRRVALLPPPLPLICLLIHFLPLSLLLVRSRDLGTDRYRPSPRSTFYPLVAERAMLHSVNISLCSCFTPLSLS